MKVTEWAAVTSVCPVSRFLFRKSQIEDRNKTPSFRHRFKKWKIESAGRMMRDNIKGNGGTWSPPIKSFEMLKVGWQLETGRHVCILKPKAFFYLITHLKRIGASEPPGGHSVTWMNSSQAPQDWAQAWRCTQGLPPEQKDVTLKLHRNKTKTNKGIFFFFLPLFKRDDMVYEWEWVRASAALYQTSP